MKKVVVMSDNHGYDEAIRKVKELEPDADYYIHCGDSCTSNPFVLDDMICVKGNNDYYLDLPRYAKIQIEDLKVLITHGQYYGYFNREKQMRQDLKEQGCDVLFSGHTHVPSFLEKHHHYYLNPGSLTLPRGGSGPSYAVVYIDGKKLKAEFKALDLDD